MLPVKISLEPHARIPSYQSSGSAGLDVYAYLEQDILLAPGETKLVPTGIRLEIPEGYEAQIRPRSGLALKHGITMLNSPGTIDSDYRGEVKIITTNLGKEPFTISNGMRIAQMVFNRIERVEFTIARDLSETERNEGGFGHTGL